MARVVCIGGPEDGKSFELEPEIDGYEFQEVMETATTHYYDRRGDTLVFSRTEKRERRKGFYSDDDWEVVE